jgi:hypothetical protein
MPIRPLLQQHSFTPEEISMLTSVFEDALRELRLVDRNDPADILMNEHGRRALCPISDRTRQRAELAIEPANLVANRIIELAKQGERDPVRLREGVVKGI